MTSDADQFDVCPQGEEADSFHERILSGLQDRFTETAGQHQRILAISEDQRDQDEIAFLQAYDQVSIGLKQLEDPGLAYDRKYALAQEIQHLLLDMELL